MTTSTCWCDGSGAGGHRRAGTPGLRLRASPSRRGPSARQHAADMVGEGVPSSATCTGARIDAARPMPTPISAAGAAGFRGIPARALARRPACTSASMDRARARRPICSGSPTPCGSSARIDSRACWPRPAAGTLAAHPDVLGYLRTPSMRACPTRRFDGLGDPRISGWSSSRCRVGDRPGLLGRLQLLVQTRTLSSSRNAATSAFPSSCGGDPKVQSLGETARRALSARGSGCRAT